MSNNVLVLGAGVAGLSTSARLRELLPDDDRVVLVDRSFTGVQGLSLLWLLRGWRALDDVTVIPGGGVLPGVERVTATIEHLDLDQRQVRTDNGPLHYDALVIALGAGFDTAKLPGLDEAFAAGSAVHYYTPDAAVDAHAKVSRIRSGKIVFLVTSVPFKCPAAPYEGAMLVADLLTENGARDTTTVDLYTPEPQPMPVAGPVVGQGVTQMLDAQKIGFHPGRQAERIDAAGGQIIFTDGERVPYDLLVFIPPHVPPAPVKNAGLSPAGWVPVDPTTLAAETAGVWALGDVSSITLGNGKPLPKAAVFAAGEADAVAAGVARHLGYAAPEPHFGGNGHCYLEVGGHRAAKGAGNFYHPDGPQVEMSEPSEELHRAKEREEADWLATWNAAAPAG
ncbi:NAD(P)/FAD-dependent oxidoreductase [Actinomadura sp. 3N508]|uniref:NAD(P)/FAD-dependent oxidoreductase n=1 Tax=Actinomadura sp. 3N508 TaxID=3375153 RepID=UPI00378FDD5E